MHNHNHMWLCPCMHKRSIIEQLLCTVSMSMFEINFFPPMLTLNCSPSSIVKFFHISEKYLIGLYQADDTRIPLPRKSLWTLQKNCRLQSWTLYKSADCRWISIAIPCVSFTNSATVERLEQVQLCNWLIDQSADNITGLKYAKECLILKYKHIQNPCLYHVFLYCKW